MPKIAAPLRTAIFRLSLPYMRQNYNLFGRTFKVRQSTRDVFVSVKLVFTLSVELYALVYLP